MAGTRKKPTRTDADISFELYEQLKAVLKDLDRIDKAIPCEVSRIAMACCQSESDAIIVKRKDNLLHSIQTIARDHLHWGGKLIQQGWTAEQAERGFDQGNGRRVKPKGKFKIEEW